MAGQKRKTVSAVVPVRKRESWTQCPYVVAVAEIGKQVRVSNKPPRSAPKRVAVVVNGDLARNEGSAGGNAGRTECRAKGACTSDIAARIFEARDGPAETQDGERSPPSGFGRCQKHRSRSRNRDRKVTGFYEESLPMEGIPGSTSRRLSRADGNGSLGGSFLIRNIQAKAWNRDEKKERRQGCQRLDRNVTPEAQKTPARNT